MTIYTALPYPDDKYASLVFERKLKDLESYRFFGKPVNNWKPIKFKWFLKEGQQQASLVYSDIVLVYGAGLDIAVNEKAKNILCDLFGESVQFLPINVAGESHCWYLVNVLNVIPDALDLDKSEFRTRKDGSKGRLIKKVFYEKNIPENSVFVFPESPFSLMIRGEFLEKTLNEYSLTGLNFKPCDSEMNLTSDMQAS